MKPETRLDSAVFQLTPTRTRCDLVIIANGKTEKLASGLLNPFLAHLKAAQDQIAKGGYSIMLKPDQRTDAVWFTKGTVERFVRFVSTPEVLERVSTIESEILQIEEAITIQGNDNLGIGSVVGDHQTRTGSATGSKSTFDADTEKAIILYKPGSHPPDSNGSATQEENSKVQLLRVLEARKSVLQKEQGMAFARAKAAGFDMDHMVHLISFAESFGGLRLKEACLQFMELWKGKHETGQWLEIEATETMSSRHDFCAFNGSGIILSGDSMRQTENMDAWPLHGGHLSADNNGKVGNHASAGPNLDHNKGRRLPTDSLGPHEHSQGQFRHPAFPQWPPVYPPYPIQGMPCYQNYPGISPFFQAPYPPTEDCRFNTPPRMGLKRHSMDSKDSIVNSEGALSARSQDNAYQTMSEFEKEDSQGHDSHKNGSRTGKMKPGMVVIRNINYITSKRPEKSGSESNSGSESETEEETEDSDAPLRKNKKSSRSSKKKRNQTKSSETTNVYEKDEVIHGQEADSGNWQVFQSFLLRSKEENTSKVEKDLFADEKNPTVKRRQDKNAADPILPLERDSGDVQERMVSFDSLNGSARGTKWVASNDEFVIPTEERCLRDGQRDEQFKEIEGGRRRFWRSTNDDFMVYGGDKKLGSKNSIDSLAENEYRLAGKSDKSSSHDIINDSIVVSLRSGSHDQPGTESRMAIDVDSELPSSLQRTKNFSSKAKTQLSYRPDELSMMPKRELERKSARYDPARDYDLQIPVDAGKVRSRNQEDTSKSTKEGLKKSDKEKKLKASQNSSEKRRMDVLTRNGKSSRSNQLSEAQKRAEKLRAYKADLQKVKKDKEEEERKRLEVLKRERQKRIAARSSSHTTPSPLTPKQTVARLPAKPSPSSYRGSKFSDSEPVSSSPLHKLPVRTTSIGCNASQKTTKKSRLSGKSHLENGLTRSASSLSDLKKESHGLTPEARAASIRRLSEPKGSNIRRASSLKPVGAQVLKKNIPNEPQMKRISAIMHLDKTKSATLPELKIRPLKGTSDAGQKRLATKETVQKGRGSGTTLTSERIQAKRTSKESSKTNISEENPVIEKTVVMLETEMVPSTRVEVSQEMIGTKDRPCAVSRVEKTEFVSEYAAIHALPSPINISELKDANGYKVDDQLNAYEVIMDCPKNESEKVSSSTAAEKPYQAPIARLTSLEDPATRNLEYTKAPPAVTSEMGAKCAESTRAYVSNNFVHSSSGGQVHEKSQSKESSRGLRKLLKFGRKGHSLASGEHGMESEGSTVDDRPAVASSNDVHMLKNLISQGSQHGETPPKASHMFSILSPFRSKISDKKLAA